MKSWPTAVVLSLYTGRLLCEFGDMHAFAEYLVGTPVWTHQFAHRPFVDEMKAALERQQPSLRAVRVDDVTTDNWQACRDREVARLGPTLMITPMGETEHYRDGFTEPLKGKRVIAVSGKPSPRGA